MQVQEAVNNIQINELSFGSNINQAVEVGNRADFALLLAMLSGDARDIQPLEPFNPEVSSENEIRAKFGVNKPQPLRSDQDTYTNGAAIARQFHEGGIAGARLQSGLKPDALAYVAERTNGLGEDVYRNLSLHGQKLASKEDPSSLSTNELYHKLVIAQRTHQIQAQV